MDLRHLRYFVTVAETLHFSKAAEILHIAQPALSSQIKDLEEMLGGKLFVRDKRNVSLTWAGQRLLIEARIMLRQMEHFQDVARRTMAGEMGLLRIGYSGNAAYSGLLGESLQAFKMQMHDVELRLLEMDPVSQIQSLETRQIDVAFLTTLSLTLPPEFACMRLAEFPMYVALPENHRLAKSRSVNLRSLNKEHFVVYSAHEGDDGTSVVRQLAGFTPHTAQRAETPVAVLTLVGAGQGIALLSSLLCQAGPNAGVVFKPVQDVPANMDVSVVYWADEQDPAVTRFLHTLQSMLPGQASP